MAQHRQAIRYPAVELLAQAKRPPLHQEPRQNRNQEPTKNLLQSSKFTAQRREPELSILINAVCASLEAKALFEKFAST